MYARRERVPSPAAAANAIITANCTVRGSKLPIDASRLRRATATIVATAVMRVVRRAERTATPNIAMAAAITTPGARVPVIAAAP